ncbi:MAG TPA: hypothetical protein VFC93_08705 [Chloroflexota bacterium]|nr:hypothetical protein [Chloroflexota bacterium]
MASLASCAASWLAPWLPLIAVAAALVVLRPLVLAPRLRRVGPPAPGVESLAALLADGRYRGVPVREEPAGPYGGGRWLPGRGEIRLARGMLARRDVDAVMILEHERGHAAGDLPAPRAYRVGLVAAFLAALALGLNGRLDPHAAAAVMGAAYAIAALHVLRNEWAASVYALRLARAWPPALRRAALARLATAYGVYLAEWAPLGLVVLALAALVSCR